MLRVVQLVCRPVALWHDSIRGPPKAQPTVSWQASERSRPLESVAKIELRNPSTAATEWQRFHALEQVQLRWLEESDSRRQNYMYSIVSAERGSGKVNATARM